MCDSGRPAGGGGRVTKAAHSPDTFTSVALNAMLRADHARVMTDDGTLEAICHGNQED
jgi:hypothetical protein